MISPETILEFGCNSGPNARFLSKLEIKEYYGLDDNVASVLEFVKNNINDNRFKFINNHTQIELFKSIDYNSIDLFLSVYLCYLTKEDCLELSQFTVILYNC